MKGAKVSFQQDISHCKQNSSSLLESVQVYFLSFKISHSKILWWLDLKQDAWLPELADVRLIWRPFLFQLGRNNLAGKFLLRMGVTLSCAPVSMHRISCGKRDLAKWSIWVQPMWLLESWKGCGQQEAQKRSRQNAFLGRDLLVGMNP